MPAVEADPMLAGVVVDQEKLNGLLVCSPGFPKEKAGLVSDATVESCTGFIVTLPGIPNENAGLLSVLSWAGFALVPKEKAG